MSDQHEWDMAYRKQTKCVGGNSSTKSSTDAYTPVNYIQFGGIINDPLLRLRCYWCNGPQPPPLQALRNHVRNLNGEGGSDSSLFLPSMDCVLGSCSHALCDTSHAAGGVTIPKQCSSVLGSSPHALRDTSQAVGGATIPKRCSYLGGIKRNPSWSCAMRPWT